MNLFTLQSDDPRYSDVVNSLYRPYPRSKEPTSGKVITLTYMVNIICQRWNHLILPPSYEYVSHSDS